MDKLKRIKNTADETSALLLNPRFIGPCIAGMFCLAVATVVGVAYLFVMAATLLALPVAGYIIGSFTLRACKATREQRLTVTQGERAAAAVTIECAGGLLPRGLVVTDILPKLVKAETPQGIEIEDPGKTRAVMWIKAEKRGRYRLGPLIASAFDPLGMFRMRRAIGRTAELLVYPKPVPIRVASPSQASVEFGVESPVNRRAPRGDFAGVRDYRAGDEIRRVHWKTTARTQRLAVTEYEDSTADLLTVAVDLSIGSDYGHGTNTSLDTATGVAAYVLRERMRAGKRTRLLLSCGQKLTRIDVRGIAELTRALTALAEARADSSVRISELVTAKRTGKDLLLILTRPAEESVEAVREARAGGSRVRIALVDPKPFGGKWDVGAAAAELQHSGAEVEVVRVV
ncbi:MAG: DUF58 domain-containing protein [Armatimonadetes bacterium]|nr:DUF58 domain-containing protein [Armatimonadota bacterium]